MSECPPSRASDRVDVLFGRLRLRQPVHGYRFSVDAVLLAHFVRPRPGWRVLDLGCGCGVVGLTVAWREVACTVVGVELQAELATLSRRNAGENGLSERVRIIGADLRRHRDFLAPESFDLALCNPPYYREGSGRLHKDAQAAQARHELAGGLEDFVRAAAFAVKCRGRAVFIFPAEGEAVLQNALMAHRLTPKRLRLIYSDPEAATETLVLVEAVKNGGPACAVLPPFYLRTAPDGGDTPALRALYLEEACWPQC